MFFTGCIDQALDADRDIFKLDLASLCITNVLEISSPCGISAYGNNLIFNDHNQQVKMFILQTESSQQWLVQDGVETKMARQTTHHSLNYKESALRVTRCMLLILLQAVKMITRQSGTAELLKQLERLYNSFEIHARVACDRQPTTIRISSATSSVGEVAAFMEESVKKVKVNHNLANKSTNGPEGTISNQTQESIKLLEDGMEALNRIFKDFPN